MEIFISERCRCLEFIFLRQTILTRPQRPDPLAAKSLCIVSLTRIFLLTQDHQSLVREITTPSLAAYIAACLNVTKQTNSFTKNSDMFTEYLLQSFSELIILHPSSFRPFVQQIRTLVLPLIAPVPSDTSDTSPAKPSQRISRSLSEAARRTFVMLLVCSPKNTAGEEWTKSLQLTIVSAQRTADKVFRAMLEDWRPPTGSLDNADLALNETIRDERPQPLDLPSWTGIHAGVERLDGLLCTVEAFVSSTSSTAIPLPLSSMSNLTDRVLSVSRPGGTKGSRSRPEIGRDEREGLIVGLPQLYISAMEIISRLTTRIGSGFAAIKETTVEQVSWVLQNERTNDEVKLAAYSVLTRILLQFGFSLPSSCSAPISHCIAACCEDISPPDRESINLSGKGSSIIDSSLANVDAYLKFAEKTNITGASREIVEAAATLLKTALENLPPDFLTSSLRATVDRVAILLGDQDMMLASVMNPCVGRKGNPASLSILPMLARTQSRGLAIEALLRPQMPMLQPRLTTEEDGALERRQSPEHFTQEYQDRSSLYPYGFDGIESRNAVEKDDTKNKAATSPKHDDAARSPIAAKSGADLPRPASPSLEFQNSEMPLKRTREIDTATDAETEDFGVTAADDAMQSERETSSKRVRLMDNASELAQSGAAVTDDVEVHGPQPATTGASDPTSVQVAVATTAMIPDDPVDSDESDFEMPTLYLDSDDEDEDEDEGEGGDDE